MFLLFNFYKPNQKMISELIKDKMILLNSLLDTIKIFTRVIILSSLITLSYHYINNINENNILLLFLILICTLYYICSRIYFLFVFNQKKYKNKISLYRQKKIFLSSILLIIFFNISFLYINFYLFIISLIIFSLINFGNIFLANLSFRNVFIKFFFHKLYFFPEIILQIIFLSSCILIIYLNLNKIHIIEITIILFSSRIYINSILKFVLMKKRLNKAYT
jgi:hypothetical protein